MKGKTIPAPQVQSAAQSAARIVQQDKETRAKSAMEEINKVLEKHKCTLAQAIILIPGQYPQGKIEVVALDE